MVSFGTTQQQIFAEIGYYRGQLVALKKIKKEHMQLTRGVLMEFKEVRSKSSDSVLPLTVDLLLHGLLKIAF